MIGRRLDFSPREWLARLRDRLRRDELDRDLAEELRFHRDHLERDGQVESKQAIAVSARRRLGNETHIREESRDRWSLPWLEHLEQDVRFALRSLGRSPGFALTVILTLGLGIGANATMFGIIDRLMFRPFPYLGDPAAVHRVYLQTTSRGRVVTNYTIPYTRFLDLQRGTTSFSQYAALADRSLAVGSAEDAREQRVAAVSASFFDFFDARPERGRFFDAAEDSIPRGATVAVLSHAFWQSEFGSVDVVGRMLRIGTLQYTIIGVAPDGFVGVTQNPEPAVFIPITTVAINEGRWDAETYFTRYNWDFVSVMVRSKPGVTAAAASADLRVAFARSRDAQRLITPTVAPANVAHPRAIAGPLKPAAGPDAGLEARTLLWVAGVAVIVLIIACANVTNLMFARILRRRREIATRLALGVSRGRLFQQLLTESLILAVLGGIAGLVIAQVGGTGFRLFVVAGAGSDRFAADWRTIAVAFAFALLAGAITSIGPALLAIGEDLAATLRSGARVGNNQHARLRSALLIAQCSLSVVLLIGAGLFVRSLGHVRAMPLGYDAGRVLIAEPNLRGFEMDSAVNAAYHQRLLDVAKAIPGVEAAARANTRPFSTNTELLFVDGIDTVQKLGRFVIQLATPEYFTVMSTRIVRGRSFTAADNGRAPLVTVVSQSMARALWPAEDAIGKCIRISADTMPCTTVIGIAENAAYNNLTDEKRFVHYLPLTQFHPASGNVYLLELRPAAVASSVELVRSALQKAMPGQGYVTVRPLDDLVGVQQRSWAFGATMFVAFGALALLVAAVGLYGAIAYNVEQRKHELGVRIALGAQAGDVVRLIVGQGAALAALSVALGCGVASIAAKWIQPLLFQQSARDPSTYVAVGALIILVWIGASAGPALRATGADPNTVLRND